jgi:sarcosine oxidase
VVASPCSGHGFKFASVIGEALADLATTGTSKLDLSLFDMKRFEETSAVLE